MGRVASLALVALSIVSCAARPARPPCNGFTLDKCGATHDEVLAMYRAQCPNAPVTIRTCGARDQVLVPLALDMAVYDYDHTTGAFVSRLYCSDVRYSAKPDPCDKVMDSDGSPSCKFHSICDPETK